MLIHIHFSKFLIINYANFIYNYFSPFRKACLYFKEEGKAKWEERVDSYPPAQNEC